MALHCPVCGASCSEGAECCPDCGAKLEAPPRPPEHPRLSMNWLEFLIRAGTIFWTVLNLHYFYINFEYSFFDEERHIRYGNFPMLCPYDRARCVGQLILAILALISRHRLIGRYQNAPKLYLLFRWLNFFVFYIGQSVRFILFPDDFMPYIVQVGIRMIIHILSIIAETIYFKKRSYYFYK